MYQKRCRGQRISVEMRAKKTHTGSLPYCAIFAQNTQQSAQNTGRLWRIFRNSASLAEEKSKNIAPPEEKYHNGTTFAIIVM
jgi:hypothetical protein